MCDVVMFSDGDASSANDLIERGLEVRDSDFLDYNADIENLYELCLCSLDVPTVLERNQVAYESDVWGFKVKD